MEWGLYEHSMERRTVLCALATGASVAAAGCLGGEVVHETNRSVRVEPGGYWVDRLPGVGGSGAITYTVRADSRFDVYLFTDRADFEVYQSYHEDGAVDRTPTGNDRLGTTAVSDEERDFYVASTEDGAREPLDTDGESYFVVDHSSYGMGARPGERADALGATVTLQVVDKRIGL